MNDSKCAAKLRAQLKRFLGELLPHFSRPKVSFLGDMIYGLMAGGDVKLSSICRAYRPRITMKKAGDRLCMHLNDKRIEEVLHNFIAGKVAKRIRSRSRKASGPERETPSHGRREGPRTKADDASHHTGKDDDQNRSLASRLRLHHAMASRRDDQDPRTSRLPFLRHRRWHQDAALAMREMVWIRKG